MRLARRAWVPRHRVIGIILPALISCARSGNHDPFIDTPTEQADASTVSMVVEDDAAITAPDKADAGAVTPEPKDAGKPPPHDAAPPPAIDSGSACAKVGPSNVCGIDPQCGCGTDGTCDINGSKGETACVAPAGTIGQGSYCTQTAGCQAGLTCRYGGTCHSFCSSPGTDCTGPGLGKCVQLTNGDAGVPNFTVCENKCALEDPNACGGSGAGCFESQYNPGTTDCYQAGTKALGGTCTYLDDCVSGMGCISTGTATTGTCKRWCRVGTTDCGGAVVCKGFTPQYMLNGSQYGFCP